MDLIIDLSEALKAKRAADPNQMGFDFGAAPPAAAPVARGLHLEQKQVGGHTQGVWVKPPEGFSPAKHSELGGHTDGKGNYWYPGEQRPTAAGASWNEQHNSDAGRDFNLTRAEHHEGKAKEHEALAGESWAHRKAEVAHRVAGEYYRRMGDKPGVAAFQRDADDASVAAHADVPKNRSEGADRIIQFHRSLPPVQQGVMHDMLAHVGQHGWPDDAPVIDHLRDIGIDSAWEAAEMLHLDKSHSAGSEKVRMPAIGDNLNDPRWSWANSAHGPLTRAPDHVIKALAESRPGNHLISHIAEQHAAHRGLPVNGPAARARAGYAASVQKERAPEPAVAADDAPHEAKTAKYRAHTETYPSGMEIRVHHNPANAAGFSWAVHEPTATGQRAPVIASSGAPSHSLESALKKARTKAEDVHFTRLHTERTRKHAAPRRRGSEQDGSRPFPEDYDERVD